MLGRWLVGSVRRFRSLVSRWGVVGSLAFDLGFWDPGHCESCSPRVLEAGRTTGTVMSSASFRTTGGRGTGPTATLRWKGMEALPNRRPSPRRGCLGLFDMAILTP